MSSREQEIQKKAAQAHARTQAPLTPAALIERDRSGGFVYAGLVTRAFAFALDATVVNGCALLVGVTVGLGLSILHLPKQADAVIAAVMGGLWIIWSVGYFAFFWSSTGQTPGNRLMRIAVLTPDGTTVRLWRGILRFGALTLAAIPLLAGFLMLLWDERRRALQDRLLHTVVVHVSPPLQPHTTVRPSQRALPPAGSTGAEAGRQWGNEIP